MLKNRVKAFTAETNIILPTKKQIYNNNNLNQIKPQTPSSTGTNNIDQITLMKSIHSNFNFKSIVNNPKLNKRVFWAMVGKIEQEFDYELDVNQIIMGVKVYFTEHGHSIPIFDDYIKEQRMYEVKHKSNLSQRDTSQLIRNTIKELDISGKTKLIELEKYIVGVGVPVEKFQKTLQQMKREGSVFEPSEGYYKCI